METIKRFFSNPIVAGLTGLVVGVIIGLVVLGWWLFPVQWSDAAPGDLRADAKVTYLRSCIDAYGYNGDAARAKACYDSLGDGAALALKEIVDTPGTQNPQMIAAFGSIALGQGNVSEMPGQMPAESAYPAVDSQAYPGSASVLATPYPGEEVFALPKDTPQETTSGGLPNWVMLLCVLGLIGLAIIALVFVLNRFKIIDLSALRKGTTAPKGDEIPADYELDDQPISQNTSSYQLGEDLFDDVYSIESGGDFLGEYGVAIADSGGVGGPKRVTAFEVWLFDKNHIPTTTKVVMCEQAFNDPVKRQKLETKGEPMIADQNRPVVLETNNLRLVGKVVDLAYGQGPSGSYFERFTLNLKVFHLE